MEENKDIIKAIKYNIDNFGCIDPLDCETIEEFIEYYYKNMEDDAEKERD